jgi:hypothetical protein
VSVQDTGEGIKPTRRRCGSRQHPRAPQALYGSPRAW